MQMIQKTHVTIVGGGFTGCALALHLARLARAPISVTLLEPGKPGRGLAYGSLNPLHRVNVPAERMNLYPDDRGDFHTWFCDESGLCQADPQALGRDGYLYPRRGDFGRYIGERLAQQAGLDLRLLSARTVGVEPDAQGLRVELQDGRQFLTGQLVLCNSHDAPDFPWPLDSTTRGMAGLITDPWREDVLAAIPRQARVLILGTGLTMADTLAQLRAQGQ
ncbi:MAG TPA: FAD-dependent oxidoreductase [Thioalkalivibrio sp.]|nr:FAD-dependent oxidoreductase [Thioalkalivibrio sp.]